MNDDNNSKRYYELYTAFEHIAAELEPSDQAKLDDLIEECGSNTKTLLCTLMESGQTLAEAIKTLVLMIEILREKSQLKRRLEEENLTNSFLVIRRKKRLLHELMKIIQKRPPTITEAIFGM